MMSILQFSFFLIFLHVGLVSCQNGNNKITNLPGLNTALNFSMYSGYIQVEDRNYFYWFVESARNPSSDPVLLWLNGGPGCSSLGGLLSENGPFSPDGNGNLNLNPYSWNRIANVLYLESPAGVGFSYCQNGCPRFNDNSTANDNFQVLVQWFSQYSNYQGNDFYIAGESYAGHYIPQLVDIIYGSNTNQPPKSNFKGFAAGNPLSDQYYDLEGPYLAQYMQTHGMIKLDDTNTDHSSGNYNPYDILVDICSSDHLAEYIRFPHPFNNMKGLQPGEKLVFKNKREVPNPPPCIDDYVQTYLNTPAVQKAIHATSTNWNQCGGPPYTFGTMSMIPIYQKFIQNANYKILVYSGDADTVLNFIATERWILDKLKLPVVTPWKAWTYTGDDGKQVGGWKIQFQGLTFTTIKGAGHMVPWYQPAPAFQLLVDFLGN